MMRVCSPRSHTRQKWRMGCKMLEICRSIMYNSVTTYLTRFSSIFHLENRFILWKTKCVVECKRQKTWRCRATLHEAVTSPKSKFFFVVGLDRCWHDGCRKLCVTNKTSGSWFLFGPNFSFFAMTQMKNLLFKNYTLRRRAWYVNMRNVKKPWSIHP